MSEKYVNTIKSFKDIIPTREQIIKNASSELNTYDPVKELSERLHPERVFLVVDKIIDETKDTKTFRLIPDNEKGTKEVPAFRAGQYISLKGEIDGSEITRPYTISSSPVDAVKENFYEVTVKKTEGGFFTNYIWNNWKVGTKVESSGPLGHFYYQHLRDGNNIIGLCGGSGITPMRAIIRQIVQKNLDIYFSLFYGVEHEDEIIFRDELEQLEKNSKGKVKIIYVCNQPNKNWKGCTGYLSADLIKKHINVKDKVFYICGPAGLYKYLDKELPKLNVPTRKIHKEVPGEVKDVTRIKDFPHKLEDKTFEMIVNVGKTYAKIPAKATDTILVSLEKAGIIAPSHCRSGECGYCRSKLISGDVYVLKDRDGRRIGDKMYGYIHLCSSYPTSDLEIEIPMIQR